MKSPELFNLLDFYLKLYFLKNSKYFFFQLFCIKYIIHKTYNMSDKESDDAREATSSKKLTAKERKLERLKKFKKLQERLVNFKSNFI